MNTPAFKGDNIDCKQHLRVGAGVTPREAAEVLRHVERNQPGVEPELLAMNAWDRFTRGLPWLFEPGDLVCAGVTCERPIIRPVEELLPIEDRMQFVVVNPMRGLQGVNQQGHVSPRCLDNVARRHHIVMEIDDLTLTKPMQATLASVLGHFAPLVLVVDSGGKSLHCW